MALLDRYGGAPGKGTEECMIQAICVWARKENVSEEFPPSILAGALPWDEDVSLAGRLTEQILFPSRSRKIKWLGELPTAYLEMPCDYLCT